MKYFDFIQKAFFILFSITLFMYGCGGSEDLPTDGDDDEEDTTTEEETTTDIRAAIVNTSGATLSFVHVDESGEFTIENDAVVLGLAPNQVILTYKHAYVVNSMTNSLQKVDLSDYSSSEVSTGDGSNPYWAAIVDDELWVVNLLANNICVIDPYKMEVLGFIPLPDGSELNPYDEQVPGSPLPSGIATIDGEVFVSFANLDTISDPYWWNPAGKGHIASIDPSTKQVTGIYEMSGENSTFLYPYEDNLFVVNTGSYMTANGSIDIFSPLQREVIGTIEVGGNPQKLIVACDKGYVTEGMRPWVTVFDPVDWTITKSLQIVDESLADWNFISGLAQVNNNTIMLLSFSTDEVYMMNCYSDVISEETLITGDSPLDIGSLFKKSER